MNILDNIIGVHDAADLWNLSPGTIKNMCNEGHVKAKRIGGTWIIDATQPTPVRRPGRVTYKKKAAAPAPVQTAPTARVRGDRISRDIAPEPSPPPRLEPVPAPMDLDDDDLDYYVDVFTSFKLNESKSPDHNATERMQSFLAAYEFDPDDVARIMALIESKKE